MPIYCHFDQNILSAAVIAPASNIEAKLHAASESINNANGILPGLTRRFHSTAADKKHIAAEITNTIVNPGN